MLRREHKMLLHKKVVLATLPMLALMSCASYARPGRCEAPAPITSKEFRVESTNDAIASQYTTKWVEATHRLASGAAVQEVRSLTGECVAFFEGLDAETYLFSGGRRVDMYGGKITNLPGRVTSNAAIAPVNYEKEISRTTALVVKRSSNSSVVELKSKKDAKSVVLAETANRVIDVEYLPAPDTRGGLFTLVEATRDPSVKLVILIRYAGRSLD